MKLAIKKVGSILQFIETASRYRSDAISGIVGKHFDQRAVWLDAEHSLAFVCDDNGPMKQEPLNFFIEVPNPFSPVQAIAGDVVFVRTKPCDPTTEEIWDYEVEDLLDTDIQLINYLLDDGKQVSLAMEYFARGGC